MEKVTTKEFKELEGNVVIIFSATWCKPCKALKLMLAPIMEEYKNIKFVEIDVDADGQLAQENSVRGVPTTIAFSDQEKIDTIVGTPNLSSFRTMIGSTHDS